MSVGNSGYGGAGSGTKSGKPSLINTDYYRDARARADTMYNAYAEGREAQRKAEINQNNINRDAELAKSNAQFDASGRQNYINYMQARKGAASQLNSMGIRGGASESSLIRLGTNYNSNVAANNLARDNAANEITSNYAQMLFDLNKAYDEDLAAKKAAYLERADAEAKAEEQRQLQYFAQAITNQYKTKEGYLKLIDKLKKSNDPQKVAKIMLARQAMNNLQESSSGSGGGGGGSRRRGGGGGSYSGYSDSSGGGDNNSNNSSYRERQRASHRARHTKAKARKSGWRKYGTTKTTGRWVG